MKPRMLLFPLALILILTGCTPYRELSSESMPPPPNGAAAQSLLPSDPEKDTSRADEFQSFLETWKLSGLVPAGLVMTDEDQNNMIQYFQKLGDGERDYIVLLLQHISAGEVTAASQYSDRESGVYLNFCKFCLYDMDLDGFPEFILKTGSCEADFWYTVYTITDGELIDCGGLSGSHADLYANGSGGFVRYAGHMGVYQITVSALEGTTLVTQEIADSELDFEKGEDYPEWKEYGYEDYNQRLAFRNIPTLFLAPKG